MNSHDSIINMLTQLPFSPNLVPTGFSFSDTVKDRLERLQVSDAGTRFELVYEIRRSIFVEELEQVFAAWLDRIRQVSF
jgi:hypothetical protein